MLIQTEAMAQLSDCPKGEYIKSTPTAKRVYIKGDYDHSEKRYYCQAADDMNVGIFLPATKKVFAGFTY